MENWYALALCIMSAHSTEKCLDYFLDGKRLCSRGGRGRKRFTDKDIANMVQLKKTLTYKEIGEIYGMTAEGIYQKIRYLVKPETKKGA